MREYILNMNGVVFVILVAFIELAISAPIVYLAFSRPLNKGDDIGV